jgi:transposase
MRVGWVDEMDSALEALVARQRHLLKQLTRSNSRLRQRINRVSSPRQRKKFDSFTWTSEVMVGEGNDKPSPPESAKECAYGVLMEELATLLDFV